MHFCALSRIKGPKYFYNPTRTCNAYVSFIIFLPFSLLSTTWVLNCLSLLFFLTKASVVTSTIALEKWFGRGSCAHKGNKPIENFNRTMKVNSVLCLNGNPPWGQIHDSCVSCLQCKGGHALRIASYLFLRYIRLQMIPMLEAIEGLRFLLVNKKWLSFLQRQR